MSIGSITCFVMSGLFLLFAVVFLVSKEKGAILISGFNTLPKEQRENYDRAKMSRDMRNSFFIWFAIFTLGGVLCYFISNYFAIIAFVVWLVLFSKEVHLDTEKAFGKYKV